ncbi:exonuclease [Ectobacillus ponti]|uniref:Exonuclease n=1 Tax=Ectobacillus ponti TaxID=2961894 RepID=A0AA41X7J1_9BACI|nr:exonuclease [Ectobacillus ponti]MCP8970371.1 exonuclease [Ectobacillus ponti]
MEAEHYIVFDLERNFRPYQSDFPAEIVDMGAVKIDPQTMEIVDTFSAFVKPTAPLSKHTTKLTGIEKQDVKQAPRFRQVLAAFRSFIGSSYILVTWGKEDYEFLKEDCTRHGLDCPDMSKERRFDLQQFVFRAYEELFPNQPSLRLAVEQFGLEWQGEQHRALADAENTANIFLKAAAERDLKHAYRRSTDVVFIVEGALSEKGKRKLMRWIIKEMKKRKADHLTWKSFLRSKTWANAMEQHEFDEAAIAQLEANFAEALQNVKKLQQAKAKAQTAATPAP